MASQTEYTASRRIRNEESDDGITVSSNTVHVERANPDVFPEDEEENRSSKNEAGNISHPREYKIILNQSSEIFECDEDLNHVDFVEKKYNPKTAKLLKNNMDDKQKTTDSTEEKKKTNFTVKEFFNKTFKWVLDEHFYTGVMNNGSFISKLSEALTG